MSLVDFKIGRQMNQSVDADVLPERVLHHMRFSKGSGFGTAPEGRKVLSVPGLQCSAVENLFFAVVLGIGHLSTLSTICHRVVDFRPAEEQFGKK